MKLEITGINTGDVHIRPAFDNQHGDVILVGVKRDVGDNNMELVRKVINKIPEVYKGMELVHELTVDNADENVILFMLKGEMTPMCIYNAICIEWSSAHPPEETSRPWDTNCKWVYE